MIYRRTDRFKRAFQAFPHPIRMKVAKACTLFQADPVHPALGVKKMQGHEGIWEGRIDRQDRFTFHFEEEEKSGETICVFRNIDNHDECLKNP